MQALPWSCLQHQGTSAALTNHAHLGSASCPHAYQAPQGCCLRAFTASASAKVLASSNTCTQCTAVDLWSTCQRVQQAPGNDWYPTALTVGSICLKGSCQCEHHHERKCKTAAHLLLGCSDDSLMHCWNTGIPVWTILTVCACTWTCSILWVLVQSKSVCALYLHILSVCHESENSVFLILWV